MKKCAGCNTYNQDTNKYCWNCGKNKWAGKITCGCGASFDDDGGKFCTQCGTAFNIQGGGK